MDVVSGVVLSKIRYSETSFILNIFTQDKGTCSFMFPGGSKLGKRGAVLQPFQLISFKCFGKSDLRKISEIEEIKGGSYLGYDPIKNCVAIFISEILSKSIRFQQRDDALFNFLEKAVFLFDEMENVSYYPCWFLLQMSRFLGFYPNLDETGKFFDLREGRIAAWRPNHPEFSDNNNVDLLLAICGTKLVALEDLNWSNNQRNNMLKLLLSYYACQIEETHEIKSMEVLETVLYS